MIRETYETRDLLDELAVLRARVAALEALEDEHEQAEIALAQSELTAMRLARHHAVLAEIGRIISSSLDIDQVYERFAEQFRKLIPSDRIVISLINLEDNTLADPYIWGADVPGRRNTDIISSNGTFTQDVVQNRSGILVHAKNRDEIANWLPKMLPVFDAGLRSFLSVPLISKDQVIGVLHLGSATPNAYTQRDLALAEDVAVHIAGAIANAKLHADTLRAEEKLRESEERYRSLVEHAPEAIFIRRDEPEWEILYVNPAGAKLFGAGPPQAVVGKSLLDFIHPDNRDAVAEQLRQTKEEGQAHRLYASHIVRLDGQELDLEISSTPLLYKGISTRQTLIRDVTERKQLEAQLLHAQKMEALGTLAGGVAHDFNNLLTAIMGYTQLSILTLDPSERLYANLVQIEKAAQRAAGLTRQLLTFSRRHVISSKTLCLNDLVMDTGNMLRRLIGENIELVTLAAPDLGLVRIDPGQMEQVLVNLVVNARDAMPSGGKIAIETANVAIDLKHARLNPDLSPGSYVLLTVSDTGTGMPEKVKSRIFEPFFTTKEPWKGSGLGLSICYGIVKQVRGHITVESQVGKGSAFRIYLPSVGEQAEPQATSDKPGFLPVGNETLLLVEDESQVREVAAQALRELGYTVIEADNGLEALRTAHNGLMRDVQLVLTDMVMPLMGGKELAQKLRRLYPRVRVLYMSGYAGDCPGSNDILTDRADFMQKPFTPLALARKVREVLDSR